MVEYHDREWGVPVHDDRHFFEKITLDGAQAGLSWRTILHKRAGYQAAFANFDPAIVATYDAATCQALMQNPGIVRNQRKIQSTVTNAQGFLEIQAEFGSFDAYVWRFVGDRPIQNHWRTLADVPTQSPEAIALSRDLKQRGFKFVGPTICYAFMQAAGLINDHTTDCFRHQACAHLT